jgi:hypothetical protein
VIYETCVWIVSKGVHCTWIQGFACLGICFDNKEIIWKRRKRLVFYVFWTDAMKEPVTLFEVIIGKCRV